MVDHPVSQHAVSVFVIGPSPDNNVTVSFSVACLKQRIVFVHCCLIDVDHSHQYVRVLRGLSQIF